MSINFVAPGSSKTLGPYSPAVVANDVVYCSGQLGVSAADAGVAESNDVASQTRRALINLASVLDSAATDLSHVVKTTVYLTDLASFDAMNAAYSEGFGDHRPARVTVEVSALPAGALVEIDAIAVIP